MEQGNQLLQNSADANQQIRDENLKTKQDYHKNLKIKKCPEVKNGITV